MTTGIAFEGCGCRAAFHVGVLDWLSARGFQAGAVAGASSGALIAAAAGLGRIDALRPAWLERLGTPVIQWRRLLSGRWPAVMSDIVSGATREHLADASMADSRLPLAIVVTQLGVHGRMHRILTRDDPVSMSRAVLASCYIPGPYSRMYTIDRRPCFDGAWLERVPIRAAQAIGARRVIACVSDYAGRLLSGAIWPSELQAPDVEHCVLSPVEPLPLGTFDFDADRTRRCFEIGEASASRFAERNEAWLA
jgi:predicted acylesterase/phospholipase RssA